jgi:anti-anti-sigma factor
LDDGMIGKLVRARRGHALTGKRLPEAARRPAPPRITVTRDVLPPSEAAPSERGFRVERRLEPTRSVLAPIGELDESTVAPFEAAVAGVIGRGRLVVLDLGNLTFIDSCGLWSISTIYSACKRRHISICMWPGPERVQNVFEVTGLYDLLPFTERPSEAGP